MKGGLCFLVGLILIFSCSLTGWGHACPPEAPTAVAASPATIYAQGNESAILTPVGGLGDVLACFKGGCANDGGTLVAGRETPPWEFSVSPTETTTYHVCWGSCDEYSACAQVTVTVLPGCRPPEAPTSVTAEPAAICSGESAVLTPHSGSGKWMSWYSGGCDYSHGGTFVDECRDGPCSITVSPTATTTYYVSWSNQCEVPSECAQVTVAVGTFKLYTLLADIPDVPVYGSIGRDPDRECYVPGEVVILTAQPVPGECFAGWSGDVSDTDRLSNPLTITMDGDKTLVASFTSYTWSLAVSDTPDGAGLTTLDPVQETYACDESVTATATPDPGWAFSYWSSSGTVIVDDATANPLVVTAASLGDSRAADLTAHYVEASCDYALSTGAVPEGAGTVAASPDLAAYGCGQRVTLTAKPGPGWEFDHWEGDVRGSRTRTHVTMDERKSATAWFRPLLSCHSAENCGTPADEGVLDVSWADGSAGLPGVRYRYRIDAGTWSGWSSKTYPDPGIAISALQDGSHQIFLQARDREGNEVETSCMFEIFWPIPIVQSVLSTRSCWFPSIPDWEGSVKHSVDVDWAGLAPLKLLVYVGDGLPTEYPSSGPIVIRTVDLAPYDSPINVVAVAKRVDGSLVESAPFALPFALGSNAIWVVDLPSFVWLACPACTEGLKNLESGTEWRLAAGEVALKIPSFSISIPRAIPIIGGTWTFGGKPGGASRKALIGYEVNASCSGLSLTTGAGLEFSKESGDWEFSIGGGIALTLQASFDPSTGFAITGGAGEFSLSGKVSKSFTVADFVPALKALESVYILGDVIKSLKLEVAIAPSISATFPFVVDESASFFGLPIALDAEQGVSIDIGLGISAALKASLSGYVDAEARVTASAGWGFTLPDFVAGCLEMSLDLDASFTLHGLWWEYTYSVPTVTVCSFSAGSCGSAWVPSEAGESVAALWDRASAGSAFPHTGSNVLASGSSFAGTLFAGPRRAPVTPAVARPSAIAAETPPAKMAARPYDAPGFGVSGGGRAPTVGEGGVVDTLLMVKTYPAALPSVCHGASSSLVAWTSDNVSMPLGAGTGTFFSLVGADGVASLPIEVLNGPAAETDPAVAALDPSTVLLAWVRSADVGSETNDLDPAFLSSLEIVYAQSDDGGQTWRGPTELTQDAFSDLAPTFVSDTSGSMAVVWVKKDSASLVAEDEKPSSVWMAFWSGASFGVPVLLADEDMASARAFLMHDGAVYYARITRAPGDTARSLILTRHDPAASSGETLQRLAASTATSVALAEFDGAPWLFWSDLPGETSVPTLHGAEAGSDTAGALSWVLPPLVMSLDVITASGGEPIVVLGQSAGSTSCDLYRGTLSMNADGRKSEELALQRLTQGGAVRQPIDAEIGPDGVHLVYTTRIPGEHAVELHHLLVP